MTPAPVRAAPSSTCRTRFAKGNVRDGEYIADMVIPLTVEEARARAARFGANPRILKKKEGHHFTCRHWNEETRLCGAYDSRPRMCSAYPYGDVCELADGCCNYQVPPDVIEEHESAEKESAPEGALSEPS